MADKKPPAKKAPDKKPDTKRDDKKPASKKGYRTAKGNVTEKSRKETGAKDGSFPIFDHKSAVSALKLRGRRSGKARANIIDRAAEYAPKEAAAARKADAGKKKED